ncbi:MAG: DUF2992 family protein [Dysgonamonadaceae bacterium]
MHTTDEYILTITFDPPFWIVLFEKTEKEKYSVAREVIGTSEPTNAELMLFFDRLNFNKIHYTEPIEEEKVQKSKISFKKMQKKVKLATEQTNYKHTYSKAHEELKKQQELKKQERKSASKEEKEEEKERKFELKQEKKKQKLRGR